MIIANRQKMPCFFFVLQKKYASYNCLLDTTQDLELVQILKTFCIFFNSGLKKFERAFL